MGILSGEHRFSGDEKIVNLEYLKFSYVVSELAEISIFYTSSEYSDGLVLLL